MVGRVTFLAASWATTSDEGTLYRLPRLDRQLPRIQPSGTSFANESGSRFRNASSDLEGWAGRPTDARGVRDPCGIQSRTVLHFPAGSRNGRPYFINKNSTISSCGGSTNQGVVGSNPAGRASHIKGLQRCSPFSLAVLCRRRGIGSFPRFCPWVPMRTPDATAVWSAVTRVDSARIHPSSGPPFIRPGSRDVRGLI